MRSYITLRKYKVKRKIKTDRMLTGSLTVEAAFVMPIVILAILALLYLAFYLHDICRIQSALDLTLFKAGITVKHEADIATGKVFYERLGQKGIFSIHSGNTEAGEGQIKEYLEKKLSKGLFLIKIKGITVKTDKRRITASIETNTKVTLPGISYLFVPFSNTVLAGEYSVHDPAETIRCTEVILETGSGIKGVDEIKEKIENIFGAK